MKADEYFKQAEAARREKRDIEAVALYRQAAEKGHKIAQLRLGQCYLKGVGAKTNKRIAFIWLKKAAEGGLSEAEFLVALCYEKGYGVAADKQLAANCYELAGQHGDPDAAGALASLNISGAVGAKKNENAEREVSEKPEKKENGACRTAAMRFPKYSEQYILDLLNVYITFEKGKNYFLEKRVRDLSWNKDCSVFRSVVSGTYHYNCILHFNGDRLIGHDCDCPAHSNYTGPCKHIVATMLAISAMRQEQVKEKEKRISQESSKGKSIGIEIPEKKVPTAVRKSNKTIKTIATSKRSETKKPVVKRGTLDEDIFQERKTMDEYRPQRQAEKSSGSQRQQYPIPQIKDQSSFTDDVGGQEGDKNNREEIGGKVFIGLIIACIIFILISFIAGWVEGAAGAFIALIFIFFIGKWMSE